MAREDRQQTGAAMKEPAAPTTATDSAANANASGLVGQNSNAAPREEQGAGASSVPARGHGGAEAQPAEATTAREDAQPPVASPPPPPAAAAEGPAELSKAAPKTATTEEGEGARADNKEKSENRDKSARTSEPADDAASNDTVVQQRRAAQSRANEVQMPDGGARNQKRAADNNASSGYGNVGGAASAAQPKESDRERAGSRSESLSRGRAAKQAEKKDEDEKDSQTRTAAGHRFRREGSAWVDVNYKSSMPSTGVRRGTEGFRALVADVPEVGRVAEAIGGDVTVVVGRRAYRIH
jgi:hypothetical protein